MTALSHNSHIIRRWALIMIYSRALWLSVEEDTYVTVESCAASELSSRMNENLLQVVQESGIAGGSLLYLRAQRSFF